MKKIIVLIALVVVFAACRFDFDPKAKGGEAGFVPVESIYGIPTGGPPFVVIPLSGVVMPEDATNKKTEWSIKNDGGTNAALDDIKLTAREEGTVTVTAVIANGLGEGRDYTHDFDIKITNSGIFAVREIWGIPELLSIGNHTLEGWVAPSNAANQTILYSVKDPGTTGAAIYGNNLTTTAKGTLTITATVVNGLLQRGDFTQDFKIFIPRTGVYMAGYISHIVQDPFVWNGRERTLLPIPSGSAGYGGQTTGIVYVNGNQYIAGYYWDSTNDDNNYYYKPCYWVNGARKELSAAVTYAETKSITVDAATGGVYILGMDSTDYDNHKYCYWRVNESGEVSRKDIADPTIAKGVDIVNGFAVNGGRVYIPYRDVVLPDGSLTGGDNYYWDENGNVNTITVNGSSKEFTVHAVTVWNNRVYFAGKDASIIDNGSSYDRGKPLFFVKDGNNYTVIDTGIGSNIMTYNSQIDSIIIQNGALTLYGSGEDDDLYYWFYWNMAENSMTFLPVTTFGYKTSMVAFSDGDVFIPSNDRDQIGNLIALGGYTSIVEGGGHYYVPIDTTNTSRAGAGNLYSNFVYFSGIAVWP